MLTSLRRALLRGLSYLFSESLADRVSRWLSRSFVAQAQIEATDDFLEALLGAMDLAFDLDRRYRHEHLDDFRATYVFTAGAGPDAVGATARFDGGRMTVETEPAGDFTVRVRFADAAGLRRFLFAERQDVLDSVLAHDVELDGNLNYIYKFGYMARDLERRLGVAAA